MSTSSNKVGVTTAADQVAAELRRLISMRKRASLVIDAYGLPDALFESLIKSAGIDWTQVIVILARERTGVNGEHPSSLRSRVSQQLISRVPIIEFVAPRADAPNPVAALANFNAVFKSKGADLVLREKSAVSTGVDLFGLTEQQLERIPQILFENSA